MTLRPFDSQDLITIYKARTIRTMQPANPVASAIAVRGDHIVEVSSVERMAPWLDRHPHVYDDRFKDAVLMPGFIDPHIHPSMAALLLPMHFLTPTAWSLPGKSSVAVRTNNEFLNSLGQLHAEAPEGEPLFVWGYHQYWHGSIGRSEINAISDRRPIVVWHRGFHELATNDAGLEWLEELGGPLPEHPHIEIDRGRFSETGLGVAISRLKPHLFASDRYRSGLGMLERVVREGGHTTIGDMALGLFDMEMELRETQIMMAKDDAAFRIEMVPLALPFGTSSGIADQFKTVSSFENLASDRIRFRKRIKLFADGSLFGSLMQLQTPGFLNDAHGEWLTTPAALESAARYYWERGYQIHVHTCGDLGVELALSILEKLQRESYQPDPRFTFEHFGISTPEQVDRIRANQGCVSANVYYLHELGAQYADTNIGWERASQLARLGSLERAGVRFAVHSDFTMAPAKPLTNAWIAANRIVEAGGLMGEAERVTREAALRSITTDAAYVLGIENEVGCLRAGKKADFVALDRDPFDMPIERLNEVEVLGTMYEGRVVS